MPPLLRALLATVLLASPALAQTPPKSFPITIRVLDEKDQCPPGVNVEVLGRTATNEWTSLALLVQNSYAAIWQVEPLGLVPFEVIRFRVRTLGLGAVSRDVVRKEILDEESSVRKRGVAIRLNRCGFVRLVLPRFASGSVVFRTPQDDERTTLSIGGGPVVLPVGVGTSFFRFELQPLRRPALPLETVAGPLVVGEVSERSFEHLERQFARCTGRLVDFTGRPIVSTRVEVRSLTSRGFEADEAFSVEVDERGRFDVPQVEPIEGRHYQFRIPEVRNEEPGDLLPSDREAAQGLFGYRGVSSIEREEDEDFGDVMLLPPVPLDVARLFPDVTLHSLHDEIPVQVDHHWPAAITQRHSLLLEMARRGGEWIEFLENVEPPFTRLVLLCRAKGEPDPVEIVVRGLDAGQALDFTYPDFPETRGVLRNRSLREVTFNFFDLTENHLQMVLIAESGRVQDRDPVPSGGLAAGGWGPDWNELDFSQSLPLTYLEIVPGTYRAKFVHTPDVFLEGDIDWRGLVRVESEEFLVRIQPEQVNLKLSEIERWNGWIDALDCETPPLLCLYGWSPGARYRGEPTTAEESLYREGLRVVPILIDRLLQEESPARRLALGALLHDLTGFHRPTFDGPFHLVERWPTWERGWKPKYEFFRFRTERLGTPEQMVPAWEKTRALWEVHVVGE